MAARDVNKVILAGKTQNTYMPNSNAVATISRHMKNRQRGKSQERTNVIELSYKYIKDRSST